MKSFIVYIKNLGNKFMSKCKHKWKLVYNGKNIAVGCEKLNKPLQMLKGRWKVYECEICGEKDILDIRREK